MRIYGGELNFSGAAILGQPFPSLGHNRYLSIAVTTGGPDTSDAYEEEVKDGNYRFKDEWRPLDVRTGHIAVEVGSHSAGRSNTVVARTLSRKPRESPGVRPVLDSPFSCGEIHPRLVAISSEFSAARDDPARDRLSLMPTLCPIGDQASRRLSTQQARVPTPNPLSGPLAFITITAACDAARSAARLRCAECS